MQSHSRSLEMEQGKTSSLLPSNVVIVAYDATRDHNECELQITVKNIRMRGDILNGGDTLLVLGVLHTVTHPRKEEDGRKNASYLLSLLDSMDRLTKILYLLDLVGYQTKACTDSFFGANSRALEEDVSRKVDLYDSMLLQSAEECKAEGVSMIVKITAGTPTKVVILQEVVSSKAAWVIFDRHFRKDLKFYLKHIPCKVALIQDSLSVEVMKPFLTNAWNKEVSEQKSFYSDWRTVGSKINMQETEQNEQSVVSCSSYYASSSSLDSSDIFNMLSASSFKSLDHKNLAYDETESLSKQSGKHSKGDPSNPSGPHALQGQHNTLFQYDSSKKPILCAVCGLRSILYVKESMKFRFSEIQVATSDFSKEYLLGEGGFGHVYKGQLKDGQIIAAKVRKEASKQGYSEFFSEVHILSFARHRNIVMLLGYCCKENHNILVYEFICNKSLDWHLFSQSAHLLEWHKRHAMAIGIAKGLRFLHEECRGGPIIHRDLRPSNILLTHDFVPMLADFGLARWKSNNDSFHTRVLGATGYLAPEYAEHGIVSVRTDVYAFGIVLFQLISGRRVLDEQNGHCQHLLEWAEPLVERLALHELIDPRIGESYDTYALYYLARAAFLCVRRNPEMRPSMGEVVRLLEAENDHARDLAQQFVPHYTK